MYLTKKSTVYQITVLLRYHSYTKYIFYSKQRERERNNAPSDRLPATPRACFLDHHHPDHHHQQQILVKLSSGQDKVATSSAQEQFGAVNLIAFIDLSSLDRLN
jgi:hypothetical protein